MDASPPIARALAELDIPYQLFRHEGPVKSLEQAAFERGQEPGQIVRSILFRLRQDAYAMVLVAGPQQLSWRKLREQLGQSRLTMATPDEVQAITGYAVGTVGPFALHQSVPIIVDKSVLAYDEISIGSGVRGTALILRSADLLDALGPVDVVDLRDGS